jgi:hypothetical protein
MIARLFEKAGLAMVPTRVLSLTTEKSHNVIGDTG